MAADEQVTPADEGRLKRRVRRAATFKAPAWTAKPSTDWTERQGMRRAIAVLRTEAKLLRKEGFKLQPDALMRVAKALALSAQRQGAQAEADALMWEARACTAYQEDDA